VSGHEYFLLYKELAPCESDGPGDAQEWNLFDLYLNVDDNEESLYDRPNPSDMFRRGIKSPMPQDIFSRKYCSLIVCRSSILLST